MTLKADTVTDAENGSVVETPQTDANSAEKTEDDYLAAGFNGAGLSNDEQKAAEVKPEPEEPVVEEPLFGGYTAAQIGEAMKSLKDLESLRKAQDKLNGTLGAVRQQVDGLRQGNGGRPLQLNGESFKRIGEQFPELAELLREDLGALTLPSAGGESVDVEKIVADKLEAHIKSQAQKAIPRVLSREHADWNTVLASLEFGKYRESLPDDERLQLENSWDAYEIGDHISKFKRQNVSADEARKAKDAKLRKAITPQGGGTTTRPIMDEDAAMEQGFKAVRS